VKKFNIIQYPITFGPFDPGYSVQSFEPTLIFDETSGLWYVVRVIAFSKVVQQDA